MKTIQERISVLIELLGLTTNAFSKGIEVQPTVLYNIIKGRNNPSYEVLSKIINRYSVNPTWLFTEEGDVLNKKKEIDSLEIESYDILLNSTESPDNEFAKEMKEIEEKKIKNIPDREKLILNIFNCYNQKANSKIEYDSFHDLEMKFEFLTEVCHQIQTKLEVDILSQISDKDREKISKGALEHIPEELTEIIDGYKAIYYNLHQYQKELNNITGTLITTVDAMAVLKKRLKEKGEVRIGFSDL